MKEAGLWLGTADLATELGELADCNGAAVGSTMGMMLGGKRIPSSWTGRLNNTLKTSPVGHETVDIEEIARKTLALHKAT
jgi:hypothetical protein